MEDYINSLRGLELKLWYHAMNVLVDLVGLRQFS